MNSEVYLFKNVEQHFSQIAVLHCRNSRSHTGMMYQSENAKQNGDEAVHSNQAEVELIKLLALWPAFACPMDAIFTDPLFIAIRPVSNTFKLLGKKLMLSSEPSSSQAG